MRWLRLGEGLVLMSRLWILRGLGRFSYVFILILLDVTLMRKIQTTRIDPPASSIFVHANDSSLVGKEGTKLTSQFIRELIFKVAETNVALTVLPGPTSEFLELRVRVVLHLGVLLETLRRKGYELSISSPKASCSRPSSK